MEKLLKRFSCFHFFCEKKTFEFFFNFQFSLSSFFFRAEKEEVQLINGHSIVSVAQPQQKHQTEPKPALIKRTTTIVPAAPALVTAAIARQQQTATTRQMPKAFQSQHSNKKSLVVNGNGHSVRTFISRDTIEQNGLHL